MATQQHRGQVRKRNERADGFLGRLDERLVASGVAEVGADAGMTLPGKRRGEVAGRLLGEVRRGDVRPAFGERVRDRAADPAHRTGDEDAAPLEPRRRATGRSRPGRQTVRLDVVGIELPPEPGPVGQCHLPVDDRRPVGDQVPPDRIALGAEHLEKRPVRDRSE